MGKNKCKCSKGYQGDLCSKRKYLCTQSVLEWALGSRGTSHTLTALAACCQSTLGRLTSWAYNAHQAARNYKTRHLFTNASLQSGLHPGSLCQCQHVSVAIADVPREMSPSPMCVPALLQLSASLAVDCMGPVLSPTSATAKKAGTGGTAIKVSEKQPPVCVRATYRCYMNMTASRAFPPPSLIPCSSFSSLIYTIKQRFYILHNANCFLKIL